MQARCSPGNVPILGITFIDILGFSILIPILPYFVKHFGSSDLAVGLLFSTFAACQFVAGPCGAT